MIFEYMKINSLIPTLNYFLLLYTQIKCDIYYSWAQKLLADFLKLSTFYIILFLIAVSTQGITSSSTSSILVVAVKPNNFFILVVSGIRF